MALAVRMVNLL